MVGTVPMYDSGALFVAPTVSRKPSQSASPGGTVHTGSACEWFVQRGQLSAPSETRSASESTAPKSHVLALDVRIVMRMSPPASSSRLETQGSGSAGPLVGNVLQLATCAPSLKTATVFSFSPAGKSDASRLKEMASGLAAVMPVT